MPIPSDKDESARLAALSRYNILDTQPESAFDDLAELASYICQTPIATITLVDQDRQWHKSEIGQSVKETSRDIAFCAHTILEINRVFIVEDTLKDERFANNPLVTGDPSIRFYAGAPLVTPDGYAIGTICAIDRKPRQLSEEQSGALRKLSKAIVYLLELRRVSIELAQANQDLEAASKQYLRKIADQAPGALYEFQIAPDGILSFPFISKGIEAIHPGITAEMIMNDGSLGLSAIHPDDVARVKLSIETSYQTLNNWDIEFRIATDDGSIRWHQGNAIPEKRDDGTVAWYGIFQDITNRRLAEERNETQLERLESLHANDRAIVNSIDLRLTLKVIIDAVITRLHVDAAGVLLFKPASNMLEFTAGQGFRTNRIANGSFHLGEGLAGRAALERKNMYISNLAELGDEYISAPLFADEGFIAYYGVPLVAKGQIKGVLEIFHRAPLNPNNEWIDFFETLAGQAAIAIDNAQSFDELQRSNLNLSLAYDATIEGWSQAMDLRDKETEGHTQRVTKLTVLMAEAMGMSEDQIVHIRRGALLHDMGKLGVPDSILFKPSKLTDEEWAIMRLHPQFAFDMLSSIEYLLPALDIPYCHHEKWDGTGYPRGLKGKQIPTAARFFAVVDVWDALRSSRPYRASWAEDRVLEHIRSLSGTHFDPKVVDLFLRVMTDRIEEYQGVG